MRAHTHTETEKKKIANGEVIPFALGMAVTRAGHRRWRRAAGGGGGRRETPQPQQQQAGLQTLSEGPEEGDGGPEGHQGHRHIVGEVNARRRARNGPRKVRTCRMSHRMVCLRESFPKRLGAGRTRPDTARDQAWDQSGGSAFEAPPCRGSARALRWKVLVSCRWPGETRMDLGSFWNSARYPGPRGKASCLRAQATVL